MEAVPLDSLPASSTTRDTGWRSALRALALGSPVSASAPDLQRRTSCDMTMESASSLPGAWPSSASLVQGLAEDGCEPCMRTLHAIHRCSGFFLLLQAHSGWLC